MEDLLAHIGAREGGVRLAEGEVVLAARAPTRTGRRTPRPANIRRHVVAARRQLIAIERSTSTALTTPELREAGALRLEHPELAAGGAGGARPTLSKATLAGRLRRIEALAADD